MYIKKLRIGNVELENNIFLAPMAGITDLPFRKICKEIGNPGLVCTEMISSKGIFYNDDKTKLLLNMDGEKRPIAVQIFGSDPETMGYAAKYVSKVADIVDINFGCPAPKIVKNGDGSKLLLDLDLMEKIVREVVKNSDVPVTAKMRIGWNDENIVAVEAAKRIEKAGASAITIHGRTREQFYTGKSDWDIIKKVKKSVKIPVIGNGDINSKEDALEMFKKTNVDGIMIGRGSLGNPWLFSQVIEYLNNFDGKEENEGNEQKLENMKDFETSNKEKIKVILKHIKLEVEEKGENVAIKEMRKHICYYLKGLKNSTDIRVKINKMETEAEVEQALIEYFNEVGI